MTVTIVRDEARPGIAALAAGFKPSRLQPIVGRSAQNTYRTHLIGINAQRPNRLGGTRTNFYTGAAKATHWREEGDHVVISINQVGIALRYFGGTVRPRTKKYLTIPAIPEAHGKRASEFSGLRFAFSYDQATSSYRPALIQGARTLLRTRKVKGVARIYSAGEQAHRVVFWLVKQVTQRADPTVLPPPAQVQAEASRAVLDYANLLWVQRGGDRGRTAADGGPN